MSFGKHTSARAQAGGLNTEGLSRQKLGFWESLFNPLYFKICYLLFVLLSFTSATSQSQLVNVLSYVMTLYGAVVLFYQILVKRRFHFNLISILIIAFIASYILSSIINMEYGIVGNLKALVWMTFMYITVFMCDIYTTQKDVKREFNIIGVIFAAYITLCNIISIIMMIVGYGEPTVSSPVHTIIGFVWGRLWGMYADPNIGSVYCCVAIIICMYYLLTATQKAYKALSFLSIITSLLYIAFSDSRTGIVCLFAAAVLIATVVIIWTVNSKTIQHGKKAGIIVLSVILVIAVSVSPVVIKQGYNELQIHISQSQMQPTTPDDPAPSDDEVKEPELIGREADLEGDFTNGRFSLWQSGFEIFATTPIFGTSFRNLTSYALENLPDTYLVNNDHVDYTTAHNAFIDVLVSQGVIGFAILVALIAAVLQIMIKYYFANKRFLTDKFSAFLLIIILCITCSCVFATDVIYLNSPTALLFWFCLGIFIRRVKSDPIEKAVKDEGKNASQN